MGQRGKRQRRLSDAYRFAGFQPEQTVRGCSVIPGVRIITLRRRSKNCLRLLWCGADRLVRPAVRQVRDLPCGGLRIVLELEVRRVQCRRCQAVKREWLDFWPTTRATPSGRALCRAALPAGLDPRRGPGAALDWDTVKTLEMQYMQAQLSRAGRPGRRRSASTRFSIRKGHNYRIVVSDLVRRRPIWFGGQDRSEASMAQFYAWLGDRRAAPSAWR